MQTQDLSPAIQLSGMEYRNFYYSPDHWLEITGVDPRDYPQFFTMLNGLVGCNTDYLKMINRHFANVRGIFAMLTERSA